MNFEHKKLSIYTIYLYKILQQRSIIDKSIAKMKINVIIYTKYLVVIEIVSDVNFLQV